MRNTNSMKNIVLQNKIICVSGLSSLNYFAQKNEDRELFQGRVFSKSLRIKCDPFHGKWCLFKSLQFLERKMGPVVWPGGRKGSELTEKKP